MLLLLSAGLRSFSIVKGANHCHTRKRETDRSSTSLASRQVKTSCSSRYDFFQQQVSNDVIKLYIHQLSTTSRRSANDETVQTIWRPTKPSFNNDRCRTMSDTLFDFYDVFDYDVIYFNLTFYQTQYSNKSKSQLSRYTFTDSQQTNEPRPLERLTYILSRGGTFRIGNPGKSQEKPGHYRSPNVNKLHAHSDLTQRWQRSFSMVSNQALLNDVNDVIVTGDSSIGETHKLIHQHAYHTRLVYTI